MIRQIAVAGGMLLFLSTAGAETKVYKWTDEEGKVHYTQTPPAGADTTTIKLAPPPVSAGQPDERLIKQLEDFEQRRQARDASRQDQAEMKNTNKIRADNCTQAQENLVTLESHGQVTLKEGDSYRKLSEEERQAKISEAQGHIKEFCDKIAGTK
ncbi:MAG: DUF4124 domain-containing protein [Gammaproteobacteria bacterium]|nr:DUF4124 domain-containing protein [Gammaproteobacteria bacterium]